jgi:hypothetical protein
MNFWIIAGTTNAMVKQVAAQALEECQSRSIHGGKTRTSE